MNNKFILRGCATLALLSALAACREPGIVSQPTATARPIDRLTPTPELRIQSTLTPAPTAEQVEERTTTPAATIATHLPPTPAVLNPDNLEKIAPRLILDDILDDVTAVAFSPDSLMLAAGSSDGSIWVWRVRDGRLMHTFQEHQDAVRSLAFFPDEPLLISGSEDETVMVWQVESGLLIKVLDTSLVGKALAVTVSPDGSLIAIGGSRCRVLLRHAVTGILRRTLHQPLCSLDQGGLVDFWSLAFTQDGSRLVGGEGRPGSGIGSIQLWSHTELIPPVEITGYNVYVRDLALSPDDETLAVARTGHSEIQILRIEDGEILHTLTAHRFRVNSVAFSPDGQLLASGGRDTVLRLWSPETGELLGEFEEHAVPIQDIAFSPDGSLIASAAEDGMVILWGLEDR